MSKPPIEFRNLTFALGPAVPWHWHGGRRSVTTFFDALSTFFPAGERFFIGTVRAYDGRVGDEALRGAVRAFCAQEGAHRREHARYNDMLAARAYPVAAMEARVERLLGRVSRWLPQRWQLAVTCSLEHFTALMAHMLLEDPRGLEGADPTMAALWRWHAAEENEHKCVAFDVFRAVGGTEVERIAIMALASVIFWAKLVEHQARMMAADGTALSPREWADLGWFLFGEPAMMARLIPYYVRYYTPGFHPRDIDSEALLTDWRRAREAQREGEEGLAREG
jgi:predicted metal-dependent hydrolase